jgi:hypothetical protein
MMRPLTIVLVCVLFEGCLPIPHSHTVMPSASFIVNDANGNAVDSTIITIYSANIIGGGVYDHRILISDKNGLVNSTSDSKIHWIMGFLPDMESPFVWAWCVHKTGYADTTGRFDTSKPDTVRIKLVADSSRSRCPENPSSLDDIHRRSAH